MSYDYQPGPDRMADLGSNLTEVDWDEVKTGYTLPKDPLTSATLERSPAEIRQWREEKNITIVEGAKDCAPPILTYDECQSYLPPFIKSSFRQQNFQAPTPIQAQSWSVALRNQDMVGIAKTGSGKTLAFVVPGILHVMAQAPIQRYDGPIMLVLAPTRELARQIEDETLKVIRGSQIRTVCLYGGTPKFHNRQRLMEGVHIAIACPGRLIDLLGMKVTNLYRVSYLVMDEADRMLDMGFEPQIRMICSQLPEKRQTLMFSATWPQEVQDLAHSFQRNYIRIHVGSLDLMANADVKQHIMVVQDYEKSQKLGELVQKPGLSKILVFVATKRDVDVVCDQIRGMNIWALAIHGDKTQMQRDSAINQFRRAPKGCLVATDVAQRGLDIRDLDAVINYDFPMGIEDYVHRIGRTGRAGAKGHAFSFINTAHAKLVPELMKLLRKANEEISADLQELNQHFAEGRSLRSRYGRNATTWKPRPRNAPAFSMGYNNSASRRPPPPSGPSGGYDSRSYGSAPPPPSSGSYGSSSRSAPYPSYGEEPRKRDRSPRRDYDRDYGRDYNRDYNRDYERRYERDPHGNSYREEPRSRDYGDRSREYSRY